MLISWPAITSFFLPELTHSAFRPAGAGGRYDKADGSLRLPREPEVIALCKKSTMQGKKAVLSAASGKNTGDWSVTDLWNGRILSAASAGPATGRSRSGRAIWISWIAMTPPRPTQGHRWSMAGKGIFPVSDPCLLCSVGLPMLERQHSPEKLARSSRL